MSLLRTRGWLLVGVLFLATACGGGPREVHLGSDACDHCHMTLTDGRFAAQVVTDRGRSYVFDSIECMAEFLEAGEEVPASRVGTLWVTHFPEPGRWVAAEEARFLRASELRSPMGLNLSAYADSDSLEEYQDEFGGEELDWSGVVELVRREGSGIGRTGPGAASHAH